MDFSESDILDKEELKYEGMMFSPEVQNVVHQAAIKGYIEDLTKFITDDPTMLEQQDSSGLTPVQHAVIGEKLEGVKLLVKMGASLNTQDVKGRTCLSIATYQGWYNGVVFLLRNGAKFNIPDQHGRTALHSATYPQDTNILSCLLQSATDEDIMLRDAEGMTALHWACFHNRPKHTQLLLLKGSDPFVRDIDGRTALHWASQNNCLECITVLLHIDTSSNLINIQDNRGKAALHFASAAGNSDVIRELVSLSCTDLQIEDHDDRTPLHWAAASGQTDAVKTLLELGVEPNPVDVDEGTPLDYAHQAGHSECVKVLEEHLGLHHVRESSFQEEEPNIDNHSSNNANSKSKKNPFDFIVNFFKARDRIAEDSKSDSECQSSNQTNRIPPGINNQPQGDGTKSKLCLSQPNSQLSTPVKKQKPAEILRSIELLHLSREDNPLVQKLRQSDLNLGSSGSQECHGDVTSPLSTTNSSNASNLSYELSPQPRRPVHYNSRQTLSDSDNDSRSSPIPSNVYIRSPPPVIKRTGSPMSREMRSSPVPFSVFAARSEYTRAQIESDAAEILALQNRKPSARFMTYNSSNSVDYKTTNDSSPSSNDCSYMNVTTEEDMAVQNMRKNVRLAPLKGRKPQPLSPAHLMNKQLNSIRLDEAKRMKKYNRSGDYNDESLASIPSTSSAPHLLMTQDSPRLMTKRKKKQKNTVMENSTIDMPNMDANECDLSDVVQNQENQNKVTTDASSTPREPSQLEQRKAIDKDMRTLFY